MWKVHFNLVSSAPFSLKYDINGMTVELMGGTNRISVETIDAANQNAAFEKALDAATCCLNYICWKYTAPMTINNGKHSFEEVDSGGKTLGYTFVVTLNAKASIVVDGGYQNFGSIKGKKSDAASYFRKGCSSVDPFDQFRNFYSAIENISSKIYEKKSREPEKIEVERALAVIFGGNYQSLKELGLTVPIFNVKENTESEVVRILYNANRCELNHSKVYKDKKIPFNPQDEKEVLNSLPLAKFVANKFLEYEESSL